jgi:aspartyl-tRNA(Asn)/glutamyl-tRNA(Gln) amidotransferase subunit A
MRIGVLRHLWEEDLPGSDELRQAMEDALRVLADLGAKLETVRMRPAQDYYDVKVVIAESEAFCVQQRDLVSRPQDFGAHYLGRVLVACLFQAPDYVRAQRLRLKLVTGMQPLYERYDALVTAGMGPAPRLDSHRAIGFWDKWQKPSITTVFDVTAGPAIMVCNGYSELGLPLGMQIAGRPFDDATVLSIAHAYERHAGHAGRVPQLVRGASAPVVAHAGHDQGAPADPALMQLTRMLSERAGLALPDRVLAQLCEAAPYALAMARRLEMLDWEAEPANVFRFPDGLPSGPRQPSMPADKP